MSTSPSEKLAMLGGAVLSIANPRFLSSDNTLRKRISELAKLRGTKSWFDRFEKYESRDKNITLHIDIIRAPKKPKATIVFMPGTNAYTLLYGEFLTGLADLGFNVVAFDPRGHGRSGGKRGSYTIAELVSDYATAVAFARKQFPDQPIFACGSSQGGITAFYYALTDNSLAGLICHNLADLSSNDSVRLTRFGQLGHGLRPIIQAVGKIVPELPVPMPLYLDLTKEPVRGKQHALQVLLEDPLVPWFVRMKTMASLGSEQPPMPPSTLTIPVTVLQAGQDTIFPESYIRKIVSQLPNAELKIFPGTAHYLIVDNTDVVLPYVDQWTSKCLSQT